MSSPFQIYHDSMKGNISNDDYIFDITYSKIKIDNGSFVDLYDWQKKMLEELINFAYHNQSKAIYHNTSLSDNHFQNDFWYNMVALENGEIYLVNLSTNNIRKIEYSFNDKDQETMISRWHSDISM